jgi:hypothetical protein
VDPEIFVDTCNDSYRKNEGREKIEEEGKENKRQKRTRELK